MGAGTGYADNPREETGDHRTDTGVDINAADATESLDVPARPDSVRILVQEADGDFTVTVAFDNTSVDFTGGSTSDVDEERAVMSNQTVDITISDDSGAANTVDYDILLV